MRKLEERRRGSNEKTITCNTMVSRAMENSVFPAANIFVLILVGGLEGVLLVIQKKV